MIEVCHALGQSRLGNSFYLAGGTGLALQLRHRKSDDLDFFPRNPTEKIAAGVITREIERLFGEANGRLELREATQVTWSILGVKTSFIGYPFPLLYPLEDAGVVVPGLQGISLAHSREIAAMKAYALGRRAAARDYVDLYSLLQSGMATLETIINDATVKFVIAGERVFSTKLFLEQLCYTKDLDDVDAALRLVSQPGLTLNTVEALLRQHVKGYLERKTGAPDQSDTRPPSAVRSKTP
jgi:predicted nucleotidyltransferase component of viral defense system